MIRKLTLALCLAILVVAAGEFAHGQSGPSGIPYNPNFGTINATQIVVTGSSSNMLRLLGTGAGAIGLRLVSSTGDQRGEIVFSSPDLRLVSLVGSPDIVIRPGDVERIRATAAGATTVTGTLTSTGVLTAQSVAVPRTYMLRFDTAGAELYESPSGWVTVGKAGSVYTLTHNFGSTNYACSFTSSTTGTMGWIGSYAANTVTVNASTDIAGTVVCHRP